MIGQEVNLCGIRKSTLVCRIKDNRLSDVIMQPISEEQERKIDESDSGKGVHFIREDGKLISGKAIYLYGEVDFNNEDDLKNICKFNLVDADSGSFMMSGFDYDGGTAREGSIYPTWNPVKWFKYCHCLIGKPERIIVYKIPCKYEFKYTGLGKKYC